METTGQRFAREARERQQRIADGHDVTAPTEHRAGPLPYPPTLREHLRSEDERAWMRAH